MRFSKVPLGDQVSSPPTSKSVRLGERGLGPALWGLSLDGAHPASSKCSKEEHCLQEQGPGKWGTVPIPPSLQPCWFLCYSFIHFTTSLVRVGYVQSTSSMLGAKPWAHSRELEIWAKFLARMC